MLGGMKTYPASHWEALGRWLASARLQAGYGDTRVWAGTVGRSTRVLLGLERGESVGSRTLDAVADTLGVEPWVLIRILESGEPAEPWADVRAIRRPIHQADTEVLAQLASWVQTAAQEGLESPPPTASLALWDFDQLLQGVAAKHEEELAIKDRQVEQYDREAEFYANRGGDGNADADDARGSASTSPDDYDLAADEDYDIGPEDEAEQTERST